MSIEGKEEVRALLEETVNDGLYQMILSNARNKEKAFKVKIRPVMLRGKLKIGRASCRERVY